MKLLDGKRVADAVQDEVRQAVSRLSGEVRPALTLVQVGNDPASSVYVRTKIRTCERCGIESRYVHLPADVSEALLLETLGNLSGDSGVHGILLQLPLPPHLDQDRCIASITPLKDVDGFHPENLGLLVSGSPRFVPCTPLGIRELLTRNEIETAGKHVVILGRSIVVGKPLALLFSLKARGGDATVSICHSRTEAPASFTKTADILIAAMGKAGFVTADMVREGAVVVDVGINRVEDKSKKSGYRLVGDVEFESVSKKASFITPVPGGVGPMTVAMLMANALKAYSLQVAAPNVI